MLDAVDVDATRLVRVSREHEPQVASCENREQPALRQAGSGGMSRTQLRDLFGRNRSGDQIGRALAALERTRKARRESRKVKTKPAEYWVAGG